jgi:hypothetical protein
MEKKENKKKENRKKRKSKKTKIEKKIENECGMMRHEWVNGFGRREK